MHSRKLTIAIDGPAGAGKSTVAKEVAKALGYLHVDTGAMYRAVAWHCLENRIDPLDEKAVSRVVRGIDLRLVPKEGHVVVSLEGEDVTEKIRQPRVGELAAHVARHPAVREEMLKLQRKLAAGGGVVMDGRDIGTVVLPHADLKVFLTATAQERARRRHRELLARGETITYQEVYQSVKRRDEIDSSRSISPLRKAEDAVEIDTTGRSITEVVDEILALCAAKGGRVCSTS